MFFTLIIPCLSTSSIGVGIYEPPVDGFYLLIFSVILEMLTSIQPVPRASNTSILSIKSCIAVVNAPDMSCNLNMCLDFKLSGKDDGVSSPTRINLILNVTDKL